MSIQTAHGLLAHARGVCGPRRQPVEHAFAPHMHLGNSPAFAELKHAAWYASACSSAPEAAASEGPQTPREPATMDLIHSPFPNCDLIKVSGRSDSYTTPQLKRQIENITSSGRYKIILDLENVTYMSSSGLRVMIDTQKTCRQNNRGETVLLNLPPRIFETLELAGFLPLYKLFSDKEKAIENFDW